MLAVKHGLLVGALMASAASVQGASLEADFLTSPLSNVATDAWQYFYGVDPGNRTGTYTFLPTADTNLFFPDVKGWANGNDNIPIVGKNTGGEITSGGTFTLPAGAIYAHPGSGGGASAMAVAYLVPTTGLYDLSGQITDIDVQPVPGNGVEWFLDRVNVSGLLDFGTVSEGGSDTFGLTNVSLVQGEKVFLVLSNRGGNFTSDSTRLEFTISPVPEPASIGLLSVAALALLRRRSRA